MRDRIKKPIVKILSQLDHIWNEIFGNKDYEKFVVITRSRTGSNFLMASLNSHPNIVANREVFRELDEKSCAEVWERTFAKKPHNITLVGFKIFYYHPLDSDDRSVWDQLVADKRVKVIHLKRNNLLRTVLSGKIALKTKVWTNKRSAIKVKLEDKKLSLNVDECIVEFKKIKEWESNIDKMFNDHPKLVINYEKLVAKPDTFDEILDFLGIEQKELKSGYKKQNKEPLEELIENYHEFSGKLSKTEWGYLLENH